MVNWICLSGQSSSISSRSMLSPRCFLVKFFNMDAVLGDLSCHMSKALPANTRDTDLWLDQDRLELISKQFSIVLELFGCGSDEVDMSFVSTVQKLFSRSFTLMPLESSYGLTVHNALLRREPYGVIPWFLKCLLLGGKNILL